MLHNLYTALQALDENDCIIIKHGALYVRNNQTTQITIIQANEGLFITNCIRCTTYLATTLQQALYYYNNMRVCDD